MRRVIGLLAVLLTINAARAEYTSMPQSVGVIPGAASTADITSSSIWDSACSTTIGRFWVRMSGGWGCTSLGYANPVWWGADTTGAADSAAAFNAALAASSAVVFPAGKFKFLSKISFAFPSSRYGLSIGGQGRNTTILHWPNANGGLDLTLNKYSNSFRIHNMTFTTGQPAGGTGVNLTQTDPLTSFEMSTFDNVTWRGDELTGANYWTTAASTGAVSGINFVSPQVYGTGVGATALGEGIRCHGRAGPFDYTIMVNIIGAILNQLGTAVIVDDKCQSLTISGGSNLVNNSTALYVPAAAVGVTQVNVMGNDFTLNVDNFTMLSGAAFFIHGNVIDTPAAGGHFGIQTNGTNYGSISGNLVLCGSNASDGLAGSFSNFTVTGNIFSGCGLGVWMPVGANNNNVQANLYPNTVTPVLNAGAGNSVGVATP